jgi:hypothetical protein
MALALGSKQSKALYINERCKLMVGKTMEMAVGTAFFNSKGEKSRYSNSDLKYDLKGGMLVAEEASTPAAKRGPKVKSQLSPAEPAQRKQKKGLDLCLRTLLSEGDASCHMFGNTLKGKKRKTPAEKKRKKAKKRKPSGSKSITDLAKDLGITEKAWCRLDASKIKRKLKATVEKLAEQVDSDWHDGWEKQTETQCEWFFQLQKPLQAVLDIGVGKGRALVMCNEVMKVIADSWDDLNAVPARCEADEQISYSPLKFKLPWGGHIDIHADHTHGGPTGVWGFVWIALLRTHAAKKSTNKNELLQCLRDASVNEIKLGSYCQNDEDDEREDNERENIPEGAPKGDALARHITERRWAALPDTRMDHPMRRGIDRRFFGDKSRRTRSFSDSESDSGFDSENDCGRRIGSFNDYY